MNKKSNTRKIVGIILGGSVICLLAYFLFFKNEGSSFRKFFNKAPAIEIKTTDEGGYTFYINGKATVLNGVNYSPTPIGKGYNYDFFSDPNKPWLIDGKLMKELGINCIRLYSANTEPENVKAFISDMYEKFGIYTIPSDWLGLWDHPSANYSDAIFRERTKTKIMETVQAIKDEKGLLMWILGNENNYTFSGKIGFWTSPEIEKITDPYEKVTKKAEIYYTFVNDIAKSIKEIDTTHPIALGNGEATFLDVASRYCPDIDVLAIITYRGKRFGNLFSNIKDFFNKPVFISEFGCDSYDARNEEENQDKQAEFILSQWKDLYINTTASGNPEGNSIGGAIFEWNDEWWKHNEGYQPDWSKHDTKAGWSNGSYYFDIRVEGNMNMNEEWFGIVAIAPELENGINKRIPRKIYSVLQKFFLDLKRGVVSSNNQ